MRKIKGWIIIYFIYILECSNGAYYTGYTTDIKRRYQEHCDGSLKCKYTRSFPPKRIAACWKIKSDLSLALKVESEIKKLPKIRKLDLVNQNICLEKYLLEKGYENVVIDHCVIGHWTRYASKCMFWFFDLALRVPARGTPTILESARGYLVPKILSPASPKPGIM